MAKKNPKSLAHVLNAIDEYEKANRTRGASHPDLVEALNAMDDLRTRLEPLTERCGDHVFFALSAGATRGRAKSARKKTAARKKR